MGNSLQAGVLGMRAYQEMVSVTGNNIANADTVAFKEDRITFSDIFVGTLKKGTGADGGSGGTNPLQIGMGAAVSSVDKDMSQGSLVSTGRNFDLAVDGHGFFTLKSGQATVYTRDGSFDLDSGGYLVDPSTGYRVQRIGTVGEEDGFQDSGNSDIRIPFDVVLPGRETGLVQFRGNLSASDYAPSRTRLQADSTFTLSSGSVADASSQFSDVAQLSSFADGDTIQVTGLQGDGTAVNATFTYGAANDGTSLQDLLSFIESAFGGSSECTARLSEGKITLSAAHAGYNIMDINLSSAAHPDAMPVDFNYLEAGGANSVTTTIDVFDSQAGNHFLTVTFVRQGGTSNTWDLVVNSCADATVADRRIAGISFDENGIYQGITGQDGFGHAKSDPGFANLDENLSVRFNHLTSDQTLTGDFGQVGFYDGLTQLGGDSFAAAVDQDGYGSGSLQSIGVSDAGVIRGTFSNGETLDIAQLKLAVFDNPQGLERAGDNFYRQTSAAGSVFYSHGSNEGRAGEVRQGYLEGSNVDIIREFTRLITAQRGFQINSRAVRIANNMLQQLASIIV